MSEVDQALRSEPGWVPLGVFFLAFFGGPLMVFLCVAISFEVFSYGADQSLFNGWPIFLMGVLGSYFLGCFPSLIAGVALVVLRNRGPLHYRAFIVVVAVSTAFVLAFMFFTLLHDDTFAGPFLLAYLFVLLFTSILWKLLSRTRLVGLEIGA